MNLPIETAITELELMDQLEANKRAIAAIRNSGPVAPAGVWIESSKPSKRKKFTQVCWRSTRPHDWLNGKTRRYIGGKDSPKHLIATEMISRRERIKPLERQNEVIQKRLDKIWSQCQWD